MFCFTPSNSINDKFKSYLKGHCKDKSKQSVKCKSNVKWLWNTLYWRLYWFTVDNFDLLSVFLHGGADHLIMIFSFLWDFWVSVLYTVIMMIIPYGRNESPPPPHPPPSPPHNTTHQFKIKFSDPVQKIFLENGLSPNPFWRIRGGEGE